MSPLWIISTPIGNLDDLSPRARAVLAEADLVLAEDTRKTGILFARSGLKPKKLLSFHDHNEAERQDGIMTLLEEGRNIALVSDAGTPLMADPGYRLVRACRQNGIKVSPVPGPSAPVCALSAAGIAPLPFTFLGFLPRGASACGKLFSAYAHVPGSMVFFERKDRLSASLALAHAILGNRELAICRELTKLHEEFIIGSLAEYRELCGELLGEITVVIGPAEKSTRIGGDEARHILSELLGLGFKPKKAAQNASARCPGWTVSELYDLAVSLKNPSDCDNRSSWL